MNLICSQGLTGRFSLLYLQQITDGFTRSDALPKILNMLENINALG